MIEVQSIPNGPRGRPADQPCASCDARSHSVCSAIADADLARLAQIAIVTTIPAGQTFIHEGDPADSFFNITGGTARIFKLLPDGRRQITGFARQGHFLGLAVRDAYTFGAEAIDNIRLCRFTRAHVRALLAEFPAMERCLLDTAGNELIAAQDQMLLLGRKNARERLASFLLAEANGRGAFDRGPIVPLPMTRNDIADYLGLTIETVSRTFTRLKSERLIDLSGPHDFIIRRREALEDIAGGLT